MKNLSSSIALLALLLSGCGGLYGPYNAPVVDRNIRYGQPVRDINQPQHPRVVSRQIVSTQVIRQPNQVPAPVVGQSQAVPTNPYRPAPPPVQARPAPQPNSGWNARPQTNNTVVLPDEPKLSKPATPAPTPTVPAAPVVRKPAEKPQQPLVDEPKLAPAPAPKREPTPPKPQETAKETPQKPASVVPDEPKVVKKPVEPERPKRPAPLRPKTTSNTLEDSVVERAPARSETETVSTRPPTPAAPTGKTAVSSLLKKASTSLSQGRLDEAVAHLQNAQRIDPKNSKILYDIANIRYHQGRYRDAESFAGRASQLGGGSMSKKSWRLISKAREALGDKQGAIQAAERAAQ